MPLAPILLASTLLTQGPPPRPEGPPPSPLLQLSDYLQLSPEQTTQALSKLQSHRPSLQAKRQAAHLARTALEEALRDPATPESRLRELHEQAAAAKLSEVLEQHALLREQTALLNAEQGAKLKAALPLMKLLEARNHPAHSEAPSHPIDHPDPLEAPFHSLDLE